MRTVQQVALLMGLLLCAVLVGVVPFPPGSVAAAGPTVSIPASIVQGQDLRITLSGFGAGEEVSVWITMADFTIRELGEVRVSRRGGRRLVAAFTTDDPPGSYSVSARGSVTDFLAIAQFELQARRGAPASRGVRIRVTESGQRQGDQFTFAGRGYAPDETVALWLRTPADTIIDLGTTLADSRGRFRYAFLPGSDYATGRYYVTGYGMTSELTGIERFELQRGDMVETEPGAQLYVTPRRARQLDLIVLEGADFAPRERVIMWLTYPDGTVHAPEGWPNIRTEDDGFFVLELAWPTSMPAGHYDITAYGEDSTRRAIAPFELLPAVDNIPNDEGVD